ncbi:MAG: zinc ribbon domain-containing protein [Chloroflexota bacterium]
MVERICPACQHGNPITDRYCGKCGAPLERLLPARRSQDQLTLAGRQLPVTWRQLGRTVAVGVAALAAEAGLAWLRRRVEGEAGAASTALARRATPSAGTPSAAASVVTIVSQRVVEILDSADGRKISERTFWRRIEE